MCWSCYWGIVIVFLKHPIKSGCHEHLKFHRIIKEDIMSEKAEVTNSNGGSIKLGTTGTISALMSQELEAMKHTPQASSSSQRKPQNSPVSVPCGSIPKKTQQRRNPSNEAGSSSNRNKNINTDHRSADKPRYKPRKNEHGVPMLGSEDVTIDRNSGRDSKVDKKGHTYSVEVVDIKCNNPVSSRLKKLGFSKLSESFA